MTCLVFAEITVDKLLNSMNVCYALDMQKKGAQRLEEIFKDWWRLEDRTAVHFLRVTILWGGTILLLALIALASAILW